MSDLDFRNKAVFLLARALKRYDDVDPDVGFPALWRIHVDDALNQLELLPAQVDYDRLVSRPPRSR